MTEQDIRQWAWKEFSGWSKRVTDDAGKETLVSWSIEYRLQQADALAAWVMSGKLPTDDIAT